ncbi:unnamed protein product [Prunus armeniaca]
MVSVPRVRQRFAHGIPKLISPGAANLGDLIWTFPHRAQSTLTRILSGQGNLAHDPVPSCESSGFNSGVLVLGNTLFVRNVAHVGLVTKLVDEVEVEGQLLVIGFGLVSEGSVCGLANLHWCHGFGTKGKRERCFSC